MVIHSSIRLEQGLIPVPFVPVKRPIAPIVAAGLIAGGSTLLGSLLGGASSSASSKAMLQAQRETNEANKQIAADVNKANLDLYRESYLNSVEQWNRENAYNDPTAQAARLRAAGFNPAFTFGGQNTAGSFAMPSAAPAQGYTAQMAPSEAYSDTFISGIIDSLPAVSQSVNTAVQGMGQLQDNQVRDAYNKSQLKQASANIDNTLADTDAKLSQKGVSDEQRKNLKQQRANLVSEKRGLDFLNKLNDAKYGDLVNQSQLMTKNMELQNRYLDTQDNVLKDQNARDSARVAIEEYQAKTGRALAGAQISQINVMSRIAQDVDVREDREHWQRFKIGQLDYMFKHMKISESEKQNLFNTLMRDTELEHQRRKDSSVLNNFAEQAIGFGFRDFGNLVKGFVKGM